MEEAPEPLCPPQRIATGRLLSRVYRGDSDVGGVFDESDNSSRPLGVGCPAHYRLFIARVSGGYDVALEGLREVRDIGHCGQGGDEGIRRHFTTLKALRAYHISTCPSRYHLSSRYHSIYLLSKSDHEKFGVRVVPVVGAVSDATWDIKGRPPVFAFVQNIKFHVPVLVSFLQHTIFIYTSRRTTNFSTPEGQQRSK